MTHVITYDISDDRRRARVAALLQAQCDRIQRSVFLATLEPDMLEEIRRDIAAIIDSGTDSVYMFRQCETCWKAVGINGQAVVADEPLYWAVL